MNEYIGSLVAGGGGSGSDPSAMHYMGPVASAQDLPSSGNNPGDTYKASANFTITQGDPAQTINVEAGDSIVWDGAIWDVYQGNIDGAVTGPSSATDGHLAVFDGNSGKVIKDGGALPDKWLVSGCSFNYNSRLLSFYIKKNGADYTGTVTILGRSYYSNGNNAGSYNFGTTTVTNGYGNMYLSQTKVDNFFAQNINANEFRFSISGELIGTFAFSKEAASIADNEKGFTTGDQVYDYSEAKANKITSITNQSTDTQYPSALAVKTYVDQNGFNPSSMQTVSDPVTLNTPQADWNQNNSTAQDYIKNKPTISDVWQFDMTQCQPNSIIGTLYHNGIQVTSGNYMRLFWYKGGSSSFTNVGSITYTSGYVWMTLSNFPSAKGILTDPSVYTISVEIFADSSYTQFLCSAPYCRVAASIASGEHGYVTGDQVNTAIGNIETLLAQI